MANPQDQANASSNARIRAANSARMWSNFLVDESIDDIGGDIFKVNVDARKNHGLEERGTEQYLSTLVSRKPKKFVAPSVQQNQRGSWRGRGGRGRGEDGRGRGRGGAVISGRITKPGRGDAGKGAGTEVTGGDRGRGFGRGRGFVRGRGGDQGIGSFRGRGRIVGGNVALQQFLNCYNFADSFIYVVVTGFGTKDDWTCRDAVCRNRNFAWRTDCNRCGGLRIKPALNSNDGKMELEADLADVEMAMSVEVAEIDTDADNLAEQANDIFKL